MSITNLNFYSESKESPTTVKGLLLLSFFALFHIIIIIWIYYSIINNILQLHRYLFFGIYELLLIILFLFYKLIPDQVYNVKINEEILNGLNNQKVSVKCYSCGTENIDITIEENFCKECGKNVFDFLPEEITIKSGENTSDFLLQFVVFFEIFFQIFFSLSVFLGYLAIYNLVNNPITLGSIGFLMFILIMPIAPTIVIAGIIFYVNITSAALMVNRRNIVYIGKWKVHYIAYDRIKWVTLKKIYYDKKKTYANIYDVTIFISNENPKLVKEKFISLGKKELELDETFKLLSNIFSFSLNFTENIEYTGD